jgi:hypothetical protein
VNVSLTRLVRIRTSAAVENWHVAKPGKFYNTVNVAIAVKRH